MNEVNRVTAAAAAAAAAAMNATKTPTGEAVQPLFHILALEFYIDINIQLHRTILPVLVICIFCTVYIQNVKISRNMF